MLYTNIEKIKNK